jgi:hypothetical protein
MPVYDPYSQPISFEYLGQFKALEPLPADALTSLKRIEQCDVTGFNEAEVRAFVIDPIVKILGYDKGTDFSVDLGRKIEFLDTNKFPDYRFHLWQENFWIIEAKRPRLGAAAFGYDDLAQAIEYAVHPDINAALVVLCDGLKIEIFDREVSLTKPVLHIDKANLTGEFDKLRRLLEPMQVWFFQKRRIVRLIDKVFDKEFNLQRLDEFHALIEGRLASKRAVVLENFRRNVSTDTERRKAFFETAPLEDLTLVHLYFEHSIPETSAMFRNLVSRATQNPFYVLPKVFPYWPRDINDTYIAQATIFLAFLAKERPHVNGLPSWLNQGGHQDAETAGAVRILLKQCLTYFHDDEPRRIILMAASAIKRILRASALANDAQWRLGEVRHFMERYNGNELSFNQVISTPAGHLLALIDGAALTGTERFVKDCLSEQREFRPEVAKIKLRELWNVEKTLLRGIPDFQKLYRERDFSDMRTSGVTSVRYDCLGHLTLCLLHPLPEWTDYVLREHRADVEVLATLGSHKAKALLGIEARATLDWPSDRFFADRFFLGDEATFAELRDRYEGKAV